MKINEINRNTLIKKFEFRFKNSDKGKAIIERLTNNDSFTSDEVKTITNKLEYTFKKSEKGQALIQEILK